MEQRAVVLTPYQANGSDELRLFSFFEEISEPLKNVARTAWVARRKFYRDARSYVVVVTSAALSMPERTRKVLRNPKLHQLFADEEDPEALCAVLAACGGGLCLGSFGAVVGTAAGGTVGTALGVVPAIFTLGLSLPAGAVVGGTLGLGFGAAAGGSAGLLGGAVSGFVVTHHRAQFLRAGTAIAVAVGQVYDRIVVQPTLMVQSSAQRAKKQARKAGGHAKAVVCDQQVQATAACAAAGAAGLGTAGAVGGTLAGGALGVAVGFVMAPFTLGLSIPVSAVVGGGTGCCVGGAAGTGAGFVCGGSAGYLGSRLWRRRRAMASAGEAPAFEEGELEMQQVSRSGMGGTG